MMDQQYAFAAAQKEIGEDSRPMELTPAVDSLGWYRGYVAETSHHDYNTVDDSSEQTTCQTMEEYVSLLKGMLETTTMGSLKKVSILPSENLQAAANTFATNVLGIVSLRSRTFHANLLQKNISFLRKFFVTTVPKERWSPELCYAAAIKLIPDQFFQDSQLPLALLVIPLWIESCKGKEGTGLPSSVDGYVKFLFREYVKRTLNRSNRFESNKFSYIRPLSGKENGEKWEVMSMGKEGIIDGQKHKGVEFLSHAAQVLSHVASDDIANPIPKRPRARLARMAQQMQEMAYSAKFRSVCAQIQLQSCEDNLLVDPRDLVKAGEDPIHVMLSIWVCSRQNIPTIITIPRKKACALTPQSAFWNLFLSGGATLPIKAMLGPGAGVVQALMTGRYLNGSDKEKQDSGDAPQAVPFTMSHYDAFCSRIFSFKQDDTEQHVSETTQLAESEEHPDSLIVVDKERLQTECLPVLGATTKEEAFARMDQLRQEALEAAFRVHGAIQLLREERLFREDILAHGCKAWNAIMGCQSFVARFYRILGQEDVAQELLKNKRSICNHFAPDIYPWAHAIATCHCRLKGHTPIVGDTQESWETGLARHRRSLDYCLVLPLIKYAMRILKEALLNSSMEVHEEVMEATTFLAFMEAWDKHMLASQPSPPEPMEPISEEEIQKVLKGPRFVKEGPPSAKRTKLDDAHVRPPVSDDLDLEAPDFLEEIRRFTRTEICRIMCCMTAAGRKHVREARLSDQPTSVAAVWAVLRGVDDRDWVKKCGKGQAVDASYSFM